MSDPELLRRVERLEARVAALEDEALDPPMLKALNRLRQGKCWSCNGHGIVAELSGTNTCPVCDGSGVEK